ncbi:MAG: hydrogenase accessory protein HypB [Anaerolinea sp.]|nr:hydrogenase accessory protein HypB [Anaerolinea sp.]
MTKTIHITVAENILRANDEIAAENKLLLKNSNVLALNIMASPGAGKTSFILKTIALLSNIYHIGVIEGDTSAATLDADKVTSLGLPAVQINTGGNCHLDANMVQNGLMKLPLADLDIVLVENVGNLVCPAAFKLGTYKNVLIASIPEGDDKPYKYPAMYSAVDVLVINKIDLLPYIPFNMDYYIDGVRMLNPDLISFPVSCTTDAGLPAWMDWLENTLHEYRYN